MFCALNGATDTPRRASSRHSPATSTLLPASEVQPATSRAPRSSRQASEATGDHGSVRISDPLSVTTRVCSNCAVHLRSFVTTVQPSSQIS